MQSSPRKTSKLVKITALIIGIALVAASTCGALTFPRTVLTFSVSFTIGATVERKEFDVPFLHDWFQVEVIVSSGLALWIASIRSQNETLWSHSAVQGGQTTYRSDWTRLSSGHYNFTFATTGLGPLSSQIVVRSKGWPW
jgi:hypothetical protein